ncbi:MAG: N4-gp56 family major capsid protein [Rhodospirillaceae bacterium]|nr:N4-gp56 family major capsid protein [Rhodospirillaceae bacterium]
MATPTVTTGTLTNQVTTAFEQISYFALRSQPLFEMLADVRSTAQSHNAATVQFTFIDEINQATTALTENADVTPVAISDSKVDVTLAEYGNAVVTSAKIRGTSFLNVDADAANIIGYNMANSMDKIVSDVANGSTTAAQIMYGGDATTRGGIEAADEYTAALGRKAVAQLRTDSAPGWENGNYMAIVHPDVSYDLRSDTNVTDVIQYQLYQQGEPIRVGSIGTFNGITYIENPRAGLLADAGDSNVDVYQTLICGRQALAKGFSRAPGFGADPTIVVGPVTDTLRRFNPIGWYHLVGYGRFREKCMIRVETSSSIGANS